MLAFLTHLVHHPRRLWLRKAAFQVHLWAGILLSLYLIAIALSGSILVYKDELSRWQLPPDFHHYTTAQTASLEQVLTTLHRQDPAAKVTTLQLPYPALPAFVLEGRSGLHRSARWVADPVTGAVYASPRNWLDIVHDFHYDLLLPPTWGMQVNAIGAAVLLLLAVTGLLLWWPGLRAWARGLRINLRANWRRLNYDLHSALGFWTLAIVLWWAISGVYFGFYRQVTAATAAISPLHGMLSPTPARLPPPRPGSNATLDQLLASAKRVSPYGRLWSVSDPGLDQPDTWILLDRRAPADFSHRDIVRLRTADARVLSVWHYGELHTAGDCFLWFMHPAHFGTVWGPGIRALWALLGVSLAVLTVTGLLMYWNRYLSRRWRALRSSTSPAHAPRTNQPHPLH